MKDFLKKSFEGCWLLVNFMVEKKELLLESSRFFRLDGSCVLVF